MNTEYNKQMKGLIWNVVMWSIDIIALFIFCFIEKINYEILFGTLTIVNTFLIVKNLDECERLEDE